MLLGLPAQRRLMGVRPGVGVVMARAKAHRKESGNRHTAVQNVDITVSCRVDPADRRQHPDWRVLIRELNDIRFKSLMSSPI